MSSHYFFRPNNFLPNYYGYAYLVPNYVARQNYTVPFALPPGDFYEPHYYYPRNDAEQRSVVICRPTQDNRFCPVNSNVVLSQKNSDISHCNFGSMMVSSAQSEAECQDPRRWPDAIENNLQS
jgi:hypothetical protein